MRRAVERFSWLMYEIALKYACPVSDIIAEDFLFMRIQLSEHFTYRKLLRFTLPSVIMMVCTSIYGVVDGVFVSNFVGSDAFAAVNLIMPFLMVLGAVGFMLGTGGSALVAYTLGAGNEKRANEIFSLLIYVLIGLGAVFTIGGIAFLTPMSRLLGADETMLPVCVSCGRIVLLGLIPYMLQNTFQSFLVTAERPQLSLYVTIAAGVTICGENRVQEMTAKLAENAYAGRPLHFIGHLQRNKVRQVVGKADLIQSVGSTELLQEIEKAAGRLELCQDILLEVNIGGEAAKSGFAPEDIAAAAETALAMPHVRVRGLMTIPPVAMEPHGNLAYFEKMRWLYVDINAKIYDNKMEYLSMGMSGDFADAIRCGSNMIRVGTAIFGARDYTK